MEDRTEKYFSALSEVDFDLLEKIISENKIERGIICSVRQRNDELINFLKERISLLEMNSKLKLQLNNLYENPEKLGNDRLVLACGGASIFPKKNVLVISCGTCITFDFVNEKQEYIGGSISAGVDMRLKAMHEFTAKLPRVEISNPKNFIGRNTEQSILSGAVNGSAAEIDGMISLYKKYFPHLEIILTGGDAELLAAKLESKIFATPKLLLHSLNQILQLNAQ